MQWLKDNFGWIVALGIVGTLGVAYRFLKESLSSATGIAGYLRSRRKEYVSELERERDQLKIDKELLRQSLESLARAKDLRDDINAEDRETIRAFRRLCDRENVDYSGVEIHFTKPPPSE